MKRVLPALLIPALLGPAARGAEEAASGRTALLAGGCFWCMEKPFEALAGVTGVVSGYAGGDVKNPTYEQVSAGRTGHREVVRITYDPGRISYQHLLDVFWRNIDPFNSSGQFCDRGPQYTAAIYYGDGDEKEIAETSKARIQQQLGREALTAIVGTSEFYPAEEYHQDYYKKNAIKYRYYRWNCGRDERLEQIWGEAIAEPAKDECALALAVKYSR